MRTASAAICLALLLVAGSLAQSTGRFQSVGGEFGQSWIASFKALNPQAEESDAQSLWSWGSAPKGSMIVDGQLVPDPYYTWNLRNLTNNWLGDTTVDPNTGIPIYTFIDPKTGRTVYSYIDPSTGKAVYTYENPGTVSPVYSYGTGSYYGTGLPPIFSTNDPWS